MRVAIILCAGLALSFNALGGETPAPANPGAPSAAPASRAERLAATRESMEEAGLWHGPFRRVVAFENPWAFLSHDAMQLAGEVNVRRSRLEEKVKRAPGPRRIPDYEPQEPLGERGHADWNEFGFEAVPGTGWLPPDCGMAVGPNHIVAIVNGQIAVFTKSGENTFRRGLAGAGGFWADLGAGGYVFDPEAHHDPATNRFWIVACEQTGSSGFFNLAVSNTSDPDAGWTRHRLDVSATGGIDVDSPNMAVTSNAVYLSADFEIGGSRTVVFVLPKTSITGAGGLPQPQRLVIPGRRGMGLPTRLDQSADPQYMIHATPAALGSSTIHLFSIDTPLGTPGLTQTELAVPQYFPPGRAAQAGIAMAPELYGPRFWHSVYRNGSIWAVHHIRKPGAARTVTRWYQIEMNGWPSSGSSPTLRQWGDIDGGGNVHSFCPSIGVDAGGNAAITFARSSDQEHISMWRALRRAADPLGSFRAPVLVRESTTAFTAAERWGDYSTTVPDPTEAGVFWGHHMFTTSGSDWRTWIARYDNRPIADMDRNGVLNIMDFTAFRGKFAAGDMRADINKDGVLDVTDFSAFMQAFSSND